MAQIFRRPILFTPDPSTRPLLAQSDFTYRGYFDLPDSLYQGAASSSLDGLTYRYVGSQLSFFSCSSNTGGVDVFEFTLPGGTNGQPPAGAFGHGSDISNVPNYWLSNAFWDSTNTGGFFGANNGTWGGLWWEQSQSRMWSACATDYPTNDGSTAFGHINCQYSAQIRTLTNGTPGTVGTVHGAFGINGINQVRSYGCAGAVPSWFQTKYSVEPYIWGNGGYASELGAHDSAMGLVLWTTPDPITYGLGANGLFPTSACHNLVNYEFGPGGPGDCWYPANSHPVSFDRMIRATGVSNPFDATTWQPPTPEGFDPFIWGDTYFQTRCWIDNDAGTRTKHGVLLIASIGQGTGAGTFYDSTIHTASRDYEFQVFSPGDFGKVLAGTLQLWQVRPVNRWVQSKTNTEWADMAAVGEGGAGMSVGAIVGACFDGTTNVLYVLGVQPNGPQAFVCKRIFVFDVGGA